MLCRYFHSILVCQYKNIYLISIPVQIKYLHFDFIPVHCPALLESKGNIANAIEWMEWPDVTYAEVYDYLVLTVSFYTRDQIKAKKNLDDYNFFCQWLV